MVIRFSQFLTNLESLVAADRFGGKGTSANAGTVPGRNATRRISAPSTLARGFRATRGNYCPRISRARAPAARSVFADKLFDATLKLPFFLFALAQPFIKVGDR